MLLAGAGTTFAIPAKVIGRESAAVVTPSDCYRALQLPRAQTDRKVTDPIRLTPVALEYGQKRPNRQWVTLYIGAAESVTIFAAVPNPSPVPGLWQRVLLIELDAKENVLKQTPVDALAPQVVTDVVTDGSGRPATAGRRRRASFTASGGPAKPSYRRLSSHAAQDLPRATSQWIPSTPPPSRYGCVSCNRGPRREVGLGCAEARPSAEAQRPPWHRSRPSRRWPC